MVSNSIRTLYLLGLLVALVLGLGYGALFVFEMQRLHWTDTQRALSEAAALFPMIAPYLLAATAVWVVVSLALNRFLIGRASGARRCKPGAYPRAERILTALCQRSGMAVPQLAVIEADEMNAYASGIYSAEYTVTLTTGLMSRLSDAELEGVIAHELCHIKHRDVRLMVMGAAVTGGIALLLDFVFLLSERAVRFAIVGGIVGGDDDDIFSGWIAFIVFLPLVVIAWFMTQLINLGISRTREYMADAGAAEMTGNPAALISALQKVREDCDLGAPSGVMRMCIEAPPALIELFSTHPDTDKRIEALRRLPQKTSAHSQSGQTRGSVRTASPGRSPQAGFGRRGLQA